MNERNRNPDRPWTGPQPWSNEPPAPYWRTDDTELDRLKNRLLKAELMEARGTAQVVALRRAANEAASLAWLEPFPMLVLPELFAEKVAETRRTLARQEDVRARSAQLLRHAA